MADTEVPPVAVGFGFLSQKENRVESDRELFHPQPRDGAICVERAVEQRERPLDCRGNRGRRTGIHPGADHAVRVIA